MAKQTTVRLTGTESDVLAKAARIELADSALHAGGI
jgi:hypothetical protein